MFIMSIFTLLHICAIILVVGEDKCPHNMWFMLFGIVIAL